MSALRPFHHSEAYATSILEKIDSLKCMNAAETFIMQSQEVQAGIEPTFKDLQSFASPLCHRTLKQCITK